MSGFSSLNIAVSGLNASQRAVDIASQNISNVNTPGYSRQRIQLAAVSTTPEAHFYTGSGEPIFGGVKVVGVERIHDAFLEAARVTAGATRESLDVHTAIVSDVEGLLAEPGDDGLQGELDEFFSRLHGLAQQPDDGAAANNVLRAADSLTTQMHRVADGIDARWSDGYGDLEVTVKQLNQATSDLAYVNQQIIQASANDRPVNELLDSRDQLVRTIGDLAGGRAVQASDGTVNVLLNGITVVSGDISIPVTLTGGSALSVASTNPPKLVVNGTVPVPVDNGHIAGLLSALGSDLPTVASQLDSVAVALRDGVNAVHSTGYTLDGRSGLDFFSGTSAKDIQVVPQTGADIAVADAAGVVDGKNAQKIADLAIDANAEAVLGGPGPSEQLRILASDIGSKLQSLNRAADVQETVFAAAEDAVNSDSGVSIDEEMTNLLQYQRSYQANARVITTIDEMLDTLINRTAP
jgi:flagellar hook-associated protein 1